MHKTKINWSEVVWNPVTGCDKCSPGCHNCAAIRDAHRMGGNPNPKIKARFGGLTKRQGDDLNWTGVVRCNEDQLTVPLHWRKPRTIFVDYMGDPFHPKVPDAFLDRMFAVMALCPQHTFQLLTKRVDRAEEYLRKLDVSSMEFYEVTRHVGPARIKDRVAMVNRLMRGERKSTLPNVLIGASVENQEWADKRVPPLMKIAALGWQTWLSCEPLLGQIDLSEWLEQIDFCASCGAENEPQKKDKCPECGDTFCLIATWGHEQAERMRTGERYDEKSEAGKADVNGTSPMLRWVVVGGESGKKARPMHPEWARLLRDQCVAAGVPYFFKQRGEFTWEDFDSAIEGVDREWTTYVNLDGTSGTCAWAASDSDVISNWTGPGPSEGAATMKRVGKSAAGRTLDGRVWDEYPEVRNG